MARRYADAIVRRGSIAALLGEIDELHTLTSLCGFEALLRGVPVTVYGKPFYAGWCLTRDVERWDRGRTLSLEELAAGALILYARYLDPLTRRPCGPETVIDRLSRPELWRPGLVVRARRQFLKREGAATVPALDIAREAPTGIKRLAVDGNRHAAQQRLKPAERGQRMQLVDLAEQGRDRSAPHDGVGIAPRHHVADRAFAMPSDDIGMRLVDDEGVRVERADARQQVQIGADIAAAEAHRQIVLDLAGHEKAAATGRPGKVRPRAGQIVFGDAAAFSCP